MAEDHKLHDGKKLEKTEEAKTETKPVETKTEVKPAEKKKTEKSDKPKKTDAVVNGNNLSVGLKHAMAICNFIRNKDIDTAISGLEQLEKMKIAIPMRGEIPHRHGMMSGRYPVKAAGVYIKLLKSLKSNAIANELELEKFKIYAMPNVAPRPFKKFGKGRFKRSHVVLKLIPRHKQPKEKKK